MAEDEPSETPQDRLAAEISDAIARVPEDDPELKAFMTALLEAKNDPARRARHLDQRRPPPGSPYPKG